MRGPGGSHAVKAVTQNQLILRDIEDVPSAFCWKRGWNEESGSSIGDLPGFPGIVGAIGGFQAQVGTSGCFVIEEPAFLVQIPGMERGCHFLAGTVSGLSGWNVARPCATHAE